MSCLLWVNRNSHSFQCNKRCLFQDTESNQAGFRIAQKVLSSSVMTPFNVECIAFVSNPVALHVCTGIVFTLTCRVSSDHSILEGSLPVDLGLGDAGVRCWRHVAQA